MNKVEIQELMRKLKSSRTAPRPRAVIIKGNPAYIRNNPRADDFYAELEQLIREAGYEPAYDTGEPHTTPDEGAALWVGHSRGADRLKFAPKGVKTLFVDQFEEGYDEREADNERLMQEAGYKSWDAWPLEERPQPHDNHYKVTDNLREAIKALSTTNAKGADTGFAG